MEEITQEQAFNQNLDARMDEVKQGPLNEALSEPFTPEKLSYLIKAQYGQGLPMDRINILFENYTRQCLTGKIVDPMEFVESLMLNDI